ncbi:MAG: N-acetyltransferase [Anaerolineales bacterium]|jgi:ribosomal-protein-alanine N-acetyltransferase
MKKPANWIIRNADTQDRPLITALLLTAHWKHQHLDWFNSLELLDQRPYLLALEHDTPIACLASPPEPPQVAWLRLFAVSEPQEPAAVWDCMWPEAASQTATLGAKVAAALLQGEWLAPTLEESGFEHVNTVVVLRWRKAAHTQAQERGGRIRPMLREDLPEVAKIDDRAFDGIWKNSYLALQEAYAQSVMASVALAEERLVGYQISTASPYGIHLARLAVDPDDQGKHVGKNLLNDLLRRVAQQGHRQVTVNTQVDNQRALDLYQQSGFRETGDRYPVYQKSLSAL